MILQFSGTDKTKRFNTGVEDSRSCKWKPSVGLGVEAVPCIFHVSYVSVPGNAFYLFNRVDRQLHRMSRTLMCQQEGQGHLRQNPRVFR